MSRFFSKCFPCIGKQKRQFEADRAELLELLSTRCKTADQMRQLVEQISTKLDQVITRSIKSKTTESDFEKLCEVLIDLQKKNLSNFEELAIVYSCLIVFATFKHSDEIPELMNNAGFLQLRANFDAIRENIDQDESSEQSLLYYAFVNGVTHADNSSDSDDFSFTMSSSS